MIESPPDQTPLFESGEPEPPRSPALPPFRVVPIEFKPACDFVARFHRHHLPPSGWKFGAALEDARGERVGVVMVGKPIARLMDDGYTLEVLRCCVDGSKNACSQLYAAAWRAARALGYRRLITYTRVDEPGTSLRAAGWRLDFTQRRVHSWNRPGRAREDKTALIKRMRWVIEQS